MCETTAAAHTEATDYVSVVRGNDSECAHTLRVHPATGGGVLSEITRSLTKLYV